MIDFVFREMKEKKVLGNELQKHSCATHLLLALGNALLLDGRLLHSDRLLGRADTAGAVSGGPTMLLRNDTKAVSGTLAIGQAHDARDVVIVDVRARVRAVKNSLDELGLGVREDEGGGLALGSSGLLGGHDASSSQ